ncbi:MAG: hypothetical protein A7315_06605 [Candidatus Altiarchaeales archaeon WOR_SM1_79]|nr:MAG: hypothetical protein A7315_06605 [Candidatus Altiarchaeales archaeon WOR_SM1_79]
MKIIRDPIHGNIELNEIELRLLDTAEMQRLRHIKQNGLCYLVYPAMNSTRFEHSLGVMHLAGKVAEHLNLKEERQNLRIAGLLHDIGHCAFSHTSDHLLSRFGFDHEKNSSRIILNTEISDILNAYGVSAKKISDLVTGKGNLSKIISSEIDVDKMDYLNRDSYSAGVAYGIIDLERIIHTLKLIGNEIVVGSGGLEAAEALLIGRNMMHQTIYRHHTKRIVESMFANAVNYLLDNKKLNYEKFLVMDDIDLVYTLRNSEGYAKEIMNRIDGRELFKRVFAEKINKTMESFRAEISKNKKEIENKISDDAGIPRGFLLLDMPSSELSEFKVLVEYDNELKKIDEVSELAKALEKAELERLTFCIYADPRYRENIKNLDIEDYIQYTQTMLKKFY